MNLEHNNLVLAHLSPGEQLLWTGQPDAKRLAMPKLGDVVIGISFTCLGIICAFFVLFVQRDGLGVLLFGIPQLLLGVSLLFSPLWHYWQGRHTVYALTDRRALIITVGWSTLAQAYGDEDIGMIRRIERVDGAGDLFFASVSISTRRGGNVISVIGFVGIAKVRTVEQLMLRIFKTT